MADNVDDLELDRVDTQAEAPAEAKSSLDDILSAAIDGAETDDTAEARARDEKGRFAATNTEAEAAPEGTPAEPVVSAQSTETAQNAQAETVSEGHFRGWSPEQREAFQKLPPEAQKIALDVVKAKDSFYGDKLNEWKQFGEATAPLVNAVKPHIDRIRTVTDDPSAYVKTVLDIDYRLQFAPYAEKVQLLTQLAKNVGVQIAAPQADPFADPLSPNGEAYPVIHDLRSELAQLKQQLGSYQHQQQYQQSQQVTSQIAQFQSSTNADGTPKYPHFERVKGIMGQLMSQGHANTLEEAYNASVKPINDAVAQELAARQKAAEAAQQAAVAKAKKALPIRSSGIAPGGKTKSVGLDALLSQALDAHGIA